jgi:hypothetical protein
MLATIATATATAALLLTTAALAAAPSPAHDWYLINQKTGECTNASTIKDPPHMWSPAALNAHMRNGGVATSIDVSRATDGSLLAARVTVVNGKDAGIGVSFYPDSSLCEAARADHHDQLPSEELQ